MKEPLKILTTEKQITIDFHGDSLTDYRAWARAVYVRSAYRNDPAIKIGELSHVGTAVDEHRLDRMIENDAAVQLNYQRLVSDGLEAAFEGNDWQDNP